MKEKYSEVWQKLAAALKPHVSADTFKRWFSAVELVQVNEESVTFRVPNNIYQFWIESNHMAALQAAIVTALGEPRDVKFVLPPGAAEPVDGDNVAAIKEMPQPREGRSSGGSLGL